MSGDNFTLNPGVGGDEAAGDAITDGGVADGAKVQRVKIGHGVDGQYKDVNAGDPLPVAVAEIPLADGAATSAKQDLGNATLDIIKDRLPSTLVGDALPVHVDAQIDVDITEYTEDNAAPANPTGPALLLRRRDVPASEVGADGRFVAANATGKGELRVKHEDVVPVSAAALPLPTGAATATKQDDEITKLTAIDGKLPALSSGRVPVTALVEGTVPVSAVALPLPAGAATSALQSGGNTSLTSIDAKLSNGSQKSVVRGGDKGTTAAADVTSTAIDANHQALDVALVGTVPLPAGAATEATLSDLNSKIPVPIANRVPVDGSGVTQPVSVASLPLPAGAATAARQDTGNTTLSNIDGKTPALVSGRVPVDGSGVTQPVSAVSLPLPTGAATAARQDAGNASLDVLDDIAHAPNDALGRAAAIAGQLDDTATTVAVEDKVAPVRITSQRALHSNLRNAAGTEVGTAANPLRTDPTGTTAQPVTGSVSISGTPTVDTELPAAAALADGATNPTTPMVGAVLLCYNGATVDRVRGDATFGVDVDVTRLPSIPTGDNTIGRVKISDGTDVALVTAAGALTVDGSATTQPISAVALPLPAGAATLAEQQTQTTALQIIDDLPHAFNASFGKAAAIAGQLDDTATVAATEGNIAPARITAQRAIHTNLRDASGTELGVAAAPVRTDPTGTTTQPISGTVAVSSVGGTVTADTELPPAATLADAMANPSAPAVAAHWMGYNGTTWDRMSVAVEDVASPATFAGPPLMARRRDTANTSEVSTDGDWIGLIADNAGRLRVVVASVAGGNTAHDGVGTSVAPLPMGAYAFASTPADVSTDGDITRLWATRAGALVVQISAQGAQLTGDATFGLDCDITRLPALPVGDNVIGRIKITDGTNVATVTAAGAVQVDGSGVTQPVSAASLPLPTGAATSANQTTEITSLQLIDDIVHAMNANFGAAVALAGQLDDTSTTAATEDKIAPVRITAQRGIHANLRTAAGVEIGTSGSPVRTDPTGTTAQPVSGTVAVSSVGGTVAVSGSVTADTELAAAAALSDTFANPTTAPVGAFLMGWDAVGTQWIRLPIAREDDAAPANPIGSPLIARRRDTPASEVTTDGDWISLVCDSFGRLRVAPAQTAVTGGVAHDGVGTSQSPLLLGGYAFAAAPADVSADGDAVRAWHLRNGAYVNQLSAAGALIGGDAAFGLDVDPTRPPQGAEVTATLDPTTVTALSITVEAYNTVAFEIGTGGTGQIFFEGSNDNVNWFTVPIQSFGAGATAPVLVTTFLAAATAPLRGVFACVGIPYLRLRHSGGSGSEAVRLRKVPGVSCVNINGGSIGVSSGSVGITSTVLTTDRIAESIALGTLDAAGGVNTEGAGSVRYEIQTTSFVGTIVFEGVIDTTPGTLVQLPVFVGETYKTQLTGSDLPARGQVICPAGCRSVTMRVSAYTSGSALGYLSASQAPSTMLVAALPGTEVDTTARVPKVVVLGAVRDDTGPPTVAENAVASLRMSSSGMLYVHLVHGNTSIGVTDNTGFTDGSTPVVVGGYILDDVAGTALSENDAGAARIDTKRAQIIVGEDGTTRGQKWSINASGALLVDTELPAAAALADSTANPTVPIVGAFPSVFDGTNWQRLRGDANGVNVKGNVAHDGVLGSTLAPILEGGWASAAAPADVSADGDAVRAWNLRNGARAVQLTASGNLIPGNALWGLSCDVTRQNLVTDRTASGTLGSLNATQAIDASGAAAIYWEIDAGLTGSNVVSFEATIDGSNWFAVKSYSVTGDTLGTTKTLGTLPHRGIFLLHEACAQVRLKLTTYGAGSSAARLRASGAAPSLLQAFVTSDTDHGTSDSGAPIKIGGKAAVSALPTAVTNGQRVNASLDRYGRALVVPVDIGLLTSKTIGTYTTAQTGVALWTPASGKRIVITRLRVSVFGTTVGRLTLWFGASGDTTYTEGTDQVIEDNQNVVPSTYGTWDLAISFPGAGMPCLNTDYIFRLTTSTNMSVVGVVEGYEVTP